MNIKEKLPVLFFDEYPAACGVGVLPPFHSLPHFLLILYLENNSDNSICISITSSLYNFQYLSFPG